MYNRYIPQPDGSFQRSHIPEKRPPQPPQRPLPPPPKPDPPCPPPEPPQGAPPPKPPEHGSVSGFFRNLLPPDFDTGDLIVVLLLLLLAGDCEEDRSTAMLTLVLYLFM